MRYITIYRPGFESNVPPTSEQIAKMGAFIGEIASAGVLLATDGLQSSSKGARVRISNGEFTVTDGPFTEAKEIIGGFAIIQVDSKDEAIRWTKRFLSVVGEGESEVRLMHDAPAFDASAKA
jgi:hypothetical protein